MSPARPVAETGLVPGHGLYLVSLRGARADTEHLPVAARAGIIESIPRAELVLACCSPWFSRLFLEHGGVALCADLPLPLGSCCHHRGRDQDEAEDEADSEFCSQSCSPLFSGPRKHSRESPSPFSVGWVY